MKKLQDYYLSPVSCKPETMILIPVKLHLRVRHQTGPVPVPSDAHSNRQRHLHIGRCSYRFLIDTNQFELPFFGFCGPRDCV
jgi:hypothetical protein